MKAENRGNEGFLQRESVEHQGYAEARSTDRREGKERGGASDLLEAILDRDNLNRAYKRVKSNQRSSRNRRNERRRSVAVVKGT